MRPWLRPCVHAGGFHSQLRDAINACNELGPANAPDCSQGAFHDYWISLGGGDGTSTPENADDSPESVCGVHVQTPLLVPVLLGAQGGHACLQGRDMLALYRLEGMRAPGA